MIYLILLKILKLIYKILPFELLKDKINNFYLVTANHFLLKLLDANKLNFSLAKIKKIFLTLGIEFKNKDNEFYYKLSNLITGNDNSEENKIFLITQIKNESYNSLTFNAWLRLRDIFYLRSQFVLGGICRKKFIKNALETKIGFFLSNKDKARSRLDDALNMKDNKNYLNKSFLNYNFDKRLYNNYISSLYKIKNHTLNSNIKDNEKKFSKFLENKSVAIVGATSTENNDGLEIDSFDLVLRLNHINPFDKLDISRKGSKTDITYINGLYLDNLLNKKNTLDNQVKTIGVKFKNSNKIKKFQEANSNLIIKSTNNYNFFSFYSSLNLLPITLFDLLESDVKKIKIFHLDLYLSKKEKYLNFIPQNENEKKKRTLQSFVKHDPMNQHEILKKLYEHPKITGDEKFDKIMKLDTYEYLKKLEDCYQQDV